MDYLKTSLFIKNLNYDLETVRYLLDYDRLKETLPFIDKILDTIDTFLLNNPKEDVNNIFTQDFWNNKLPATMSFSQMHTCINKYANVKLPPDGEALNKINYRAFVQNVFDWSDDNIAKLHRKIKSPLRLWVEKKRFYLIGAIAGLSLIIAAIVLSWMSHTQDWGLKGDFYLGQNFEKYLYSGYKKTIDFSSPEDMDLRLPNDNFSDRWTGRLLAPKNGNYTISVCGDDEAKVFIDGKLLLTSTWFGGESFKKVFLSKGSHKITLEHSQRDGPAALNLYWAIPGVKKQIIAAKYLRH